jgi:(E)-4-hydroxy-3-methylbut-2-enyl-diphosphate synthase
MVRKVPEADLLSELKKEIDIIVTHYEATGTVPGRRH